MTYTSQTRIAQRVFHWVEGNAVCADSMPYCRRTALLKSLYCFGSESCRICGVGVKERPLEKSEMSVLVSW